MNAGIIYAMNNNLQPRNIKSVDFGFELAMSLIRPQIEQPSLIGINFFVVRKIEIVRGEKYPPNMKKRQVAFFFIEVKNEGNAMRVSVRLKENSKREEKQNF